jgi:hypothetical protein
MKSSIIHNPNFAGYDTTLNYVNCVRSMLNKYSNLKTYSTLEPKENPHMTRKRKVLKFKK